MESNIATHLSKQYYGNLAYTSSLKVGYAEVDVIPLNNILVKVKFAIGNQDYAFRAMLSEQEEGVLLIVEERVTQEYILSGLSGFLYKKPNVHGGLISKLNSFYFHVQVQHYDGDLIEVYFLGKEEGAFSQMLARRNATQQVKITR